MKWQGYNVMSPEGMSDFIDYLIAKQVDKCILCGEEMNLQEFRGRFLNDQIFKEEFEKKEVEVTLDEN